MVRALHAAGLEVILDVVYNHTCEGGPAARACPGAASTTPPTTGSTRTAATSTPPAAATRLDFRHARVVQLDAGLAALLGRGDARRRLPLRPGADPGPRARRIRPRPPVPRRGPRSTPCIGGVKLIAEPWDVGGARLADRPVPAAVRRVERPLPGRVREFWLAGGRQVAHGEQASGVRDLATRLAGSADLFAAHRGPLASVNFVTAHDGFTLARPRRLRPQAQRGQRRGQPGRHDDNRSWNHGVEGRTDDPAVPTARRRTVRNLLGTLLLATGVPMIVAGDEFGRTQHGNNNAYCQDNEISWVDWDLDADGSRTCSRPRRTCCALRREHPVLRQQPLLRGPARAQRRHEGPGLVRPRRHRDGPRALARGLAAHPADVPARGRARRPRRTPRRVPARRRPGRGPADGRQAARSALGERYRLLWDSEDSVPPRARTGPAAHGGAAGPWWRSTASTMPRLRRRRRRSEVGRARGRTVSWRSSRSPSSRGRRPRPRRAAARGPCSRTAPSGAAVPNPRTGAGPTPAPPRAAAGAVARSVSVSDEAPGRRRAGRRRPRGGAAPRATKARTPISSPTCGESLTPRGSTCSTRTPGHCGAHPRPSTTPPRAANADAVARSAAAAGT